MSDFGFFSKVFESLKSFAGVIFQQSLNGDEVDSLHISNDQKDFCQMKKIFLRCESTKMMYLYLYHPNFYHLFIDFHPKYTSDLSAIFVTVKSFANVAQKPSPLQDLESYFPLPIDLRYFMHKKSSQISK